MELPSPSGSASSEEFEGEDLNEPIPPLVTAGILRVEQNDRNEPAPPSYSEVGASSENDDHEELAPTQLRRGNQGRVK